MSVKSKAALLEEEKAVLAAVIAEARAEGFRDGVRAAAKVAQGQWVNAKINPSRAASIAKQILALLEPNETSKAISKPSKKQ